MVSENNVTQKDFKKTVKNILITQYEFITKLFSLLPIPASANRDDVANKEAIIFGGHSKEDQTNERTKRAKTLTELRDRLKGMQNKRLMYKDKLLKKKLKNQIKKKSKREQILAQKKLARIARKNKPLSSVNIQKGTYTAETQDSKTVFNKEGKMVFSKFDFSNIGKKTEKKSMKDPKKILKNLETEKKTLVDLQAKGETEKAKEMKNRKAWKTALARAEGVKVKDDPILLKKTIKRNEQVKRNSKKKWNDRQEVVKKVKEGRLAKRNENIAKRNKEKKMKKMKKAVKRGKIIPGH